MAEREDARERLYQLLDQTNPVTLQPMLQVITSEVREDLRPDPDNRRSRPEGEEWEKTLRKRPDSFVHHNVTSFEERPGGLMRAHTAEGDWCEGYPEDLLPRLLEASVASMGR